MVECFGSRDNFLCALLVICLIPVVDPYCVLIAGSLFLFHLLLECIYIGADAGKNCWANGVIMWCIMYFENFLLFA